ncbi:uncharacterized protein IUM83_17089 [Phytophthora cinnamomi]|uniref:uncharacterized protein n=1 Tax=Phytophthora cinnamomi TaxID=4785 RepID=UPI00355A9582|nr:hypothetical protein IUM83_17089 [Phytophthora cinnamomi]
MSLNVTFVSGASLQFVLRSTWNCWTFESCGYWEKTAQVAWSNVPTAVFVGFYESTTCHARDENGMDVFAVNGSFTFPEPKAIRSVMIGDFSDLARRPAMTNSFLRVTFPKTDNLKYNNPGMWRCLDFKNCDF